jgi:ribosome-binding ATPase YchF (GTP1/OBG family)
LVEIADAKERSQLRIELGQQTSTSDIIKACFDTADLITFYTFGQGVTRAWPVPKGTTAIEVATLIHSDFSDTFIKAQIFNLQDLEQLGEKEIRAKGKFRTEGKNYHIQDGDILWFVTNS